MTDHDAALFRDLDGAHDALGPNGGWPARNPEVARERAFHRTEIPPVKDLAIVQQLGRMVAEHEARIEALEALIADVKADLKGGKKAPWKKRRDALARIREWEAGA